MTTKISISHFQLTCVAVAVVNKTEILKIAADLNIPGEFEDLLENNDINKAVYDDFLKIAKIGKLTKQEIPSKIYLEKEPWTPESGLITDALKLKRTVIFLSFYFLMIFSGTKCPLRKSCESTLQEVRT